MSEKASIERNTLINAHERLETRVNQMGDLANLSQRLIDKMNRVDDRPKVEADKKEAVKHNVDQPNIIDLFNLNTTKLNQLIDTIGQNIEQVMSMID